MSRDGYQFIIALLLIGLISLPSYFFARRIGGKGGGAEGGWVEVVWFVATLFFVYVLTRGRV